MHISNTANIQKYYEKYLKSNTYNKYFQSSADLKVMCTNSLFVKQLLANGQLHSEQFNSGIIPDS